MFENDLSKNYLVNLKGFWTETTENFAPALWRAGAETVSNTTTVEVVLLSGEMGRLHTLP